jgi:hypothetical protein
VTWRARLTSRRGGGAKADSGPSPYDGPPDLTDATAMYHWCVANGVRTRPHYLWSTLQGARIARALAVPSITAIEFGVAGGNGLLALEVAAEAAERLTGVGVHVVGFDSGGGMPPPVDHRDVPWVMQPGWFPMDEAALSARLTRASLVLGPVADTVPEWLAGDHAPIGFVSFDLDYYSSTMDAFAVFAGDPAACLPRVPCYFDDVFGYGWSDFNGERAAIADFNAAHEHRKLGKIHGLRYQLAPEDHLLPWHEQLWLAHLFDHPRYNESEGELNPLWHSAHRLAP